MKNNTNIYDIDGEIIRKAGDNHWFAFEEISKKIDDYTNKLKNIDPNDPKATVYSTYIRNLNIYLYNILKAVPQDQIKEIVDKIAAQKSIQEQVKEALEDLNEEVETDTKETIMDEYVQFEEVNDDNIQQADPT